jgi:hypothetical protein
MGVWLARPGESQEKTDRPSVRLMLLLGEILAGRLGQRSCPTIHDESEASAPAPWDRNSLLEAVQTEVARATRLDQPMALLHLRVTGDMQSSAAAIWTVLAGCLRPYDRIAPRRGESGRWDAILPHMGADAAVRVAGRLTNALERLPGDRPAGAVPLRLAVGISVWGDDALHAQQMIEHATAAADSALRESGREPAILCYRPAQAALVS